MFVRQNQQQFRNSNADVQIFYGTGSTFGQYSDYQAWNKPIGVSHVYMLLIGSGGDGDGANNGGGSGAVTVWYGAAQHVPDVLQIQVPSGDVGFDTQVLYKVSLYPLLTASRGISSTFGSAMNPNQFTASGFFKSVAGQNGSNVNPGASTTTFLSAGAGSGGVTTANYGYGSSAGNGYFLLQPLIVGVGASSGSLKGGVGCGGAVNGRGGPGMVLIASW